MVKQLHLVRACFSLFVETTEDIFRRPFNLIQTYGPSGIIAWAFGSQTVWRAEARVLETLNDDDAIAFKKSIQDECTTISVAVSRFTTFTPCCYFECWLFCHKCTF
jgi:hypothetical protein